MLTLTPSLTLSVNGLLGPIHTKRKQGKGEKDQKNQQDQRISDKHQKQFSLPVPLSLDESVLWDFISLPCMGYWV